MKRFWVSSRFFSFSLIAIACAAPALAEAENLSAPGGQIQLSDSVVQQRANKLLKQMTTDEKHRR